MIGIGSDHFGFELKESIREYLQRRGETVHDFGAYSPEPVDYPDIGARVALAVRAGLVDRAILVCGTGLGMAIVANKVPGVFAAPLTSAELARAARRSNDTQIMTLGARVVSPEEARGIVEAWLSTRFRGGRSVRKVAKIREIERRVCREALCRGARSREPDGEPHEEGRMQRTEVASA
ncbi:MAG: ribose 5-phosphate isomerase B [Armatimonadota bacterium]